MVFGSFSNHARVHPVIINFNSNLGSSCSCHQNKRKVCIESVIFKLLDPLYILVILQPPWMFAWSPQNKPNNASCSDLNFPFGMSGFVDAGASHHQTFTALIWFDPTDFKHIHF